MIYFLLYIIGISEKITVVSTIFLVILTIYIIIYILVENDKNYNFTFNNFVKENSKMFFSLIVLFFIAVLTPNERSLYLMTGVKVSEVAITKIENSDVFNKSLKVLNIKLDEIINSEKEIKK